MDELLGETRVDYNVMRPAVEVAIGALRKALETIPQHEVCPWIEPPETTSQQPMQQSGCMHAGQG